MKRRLESSESDEDEHKTLVKKPKLSIQEQWRHAIEMTLYNFIKFSPLKNIASSITPDHYVNLSPFLVKEVLRMSNPIDGVKLALQTTVETMNDTCKEAIHRILCENGDFKTKQSITFLCETLPMPTATLEQMESDDDIRESLPLQVQHVLSNDRTRKWMNYYRQAGAKTINVFTVKLGPGVARASAETGRYIVSVLMPLYPAKYRLTTTDESYSQSYEELNAIYRRTVIELDSHKRMAAQDPTNKGQKHTKQEEAMILAGQLQKQEYVQLKTRHDEQSTEIAVLTRQLNEMADILNTADQKEIASLHETIRIITEKLDLSRRRNVELVARLQAAGLKPLLTPLHQPVVRSPPPAKKRKLEPVPPPQRRKEIAEEKVETFAQFKKRKLLDVNKRNTASSTSSSYDEDEDDDESASFSESDEASEDIISEEEEDEEEEEEEDDSQ